MISAGIRELKNSLSRYVRRVESGERVAVTAHGRVVAELGPAATTAGTHDPLAALIAAGLARGPLEGGDPMADWPELSLPSGTAADLLNADRDEA